MSTPANPDYRIEHPENEAVEAYHYIEDYTNFGYINSLMSIYLISLGEFDVEGFSQGVNSTLVWTFFFLATFLCQVVIMNMVIAIMSATFQNVQSKHDESSLYEQVQLMEDFLWLIDLQKRFSGKKFIFMVCPDNEDSGEEAEVQQTIETNHMDLANKID